MRPEYFSIAIDPGGAPVAGSLIGLERTYRGRPVDFRTHALVCLASATLMLMTTFQQIRLSPDSPLTGHLEPTRTAQGIMTGIGFLGAGVIFKDGFTVRGLTTAASIWMTAVMLTSYRLIEERNEFEYRMIIRTIETGNLPRLAESLRAMPNVVEFRILPSGE